MFFVIIPPHFFKRAGENREHQLNTERQRNSYTDYSYLPIQLYTHGVASSAGCFVDADCERQDAIGEPAAVLRRPLSPVLRVETGSFHPAEGSAMAEAAAVAASTEKVYRLIIIP